MNAEQQRIAKCLADLVGRPLDTIMHTTNWSKLPAWERVMADVLYRDVQRVARHVVDDLEELRQKFVALKVRLRRAGALTGEEGDESL
jgi:hypothetical protein